MYILLYLYFSCILTWYLFLYFISLYVQSIELVWILDIIIIIISDKSVMGGVRAVDMFTYTIHNIYKI